MIRVVKLGVISFVVVFIVVFLMSLLIPSTIRVSRAINVEAAAARIYPLLADKNNWPRWNEMINERIDVRLVSADSSQVMTTWSHGGRSIKSAYRIERVGDISVVQWYFDFRLKWYPWEKFGSITFEKQFGPPMERSLTNLKKLITKSP